MNHSIETLKAAAAGSTADLKSPLGQRLPPSVHFHRALFAALAAPRSMKISYSSGCRSCRRLFDYEHEDNFQSGSISPKRRTGWRCAMRIEDAPSCPPTKKDLKSPNSSPHPLYPPWFGCNPLTRIPEELFPIVLQNLGPQF